MKRSNVLYIFYTQDFFIRSKRFMAIALMSSVFFVQVSFLFKFKVLKCFENVNSPSLCTKDRQETTLKKKPTFLLIKNIQQIFRGNIITQRLKYISLFVLKNIIQQNENVRYQSIFFYLERDKFYK